MYKYGHRTRGHPRLQRLLAFVFALVMLVTMMPADLAKADAIEHTHIWATKYDSTNHWEYCTVCGEKRNVTAHVFTDHWYLGYENCNRQNYSLRTCSCGYSYTYHKPHQDGEYWNYSVSRGEHWKKCKICGNWTANGQCVDANGKMLTCKNSGTCVVCGLKRSTDYHYIINGRCRDCGKIFFTHTSPQITYNNDYSKCTITWSISPSDDTAYVTDAFNGYTTGGVYKSINTSTERLQDGTVKFTCVCSFNPSQNAKITTTMGNSDALVRINGYNTWASSFGIKWTVWQDHQAPAQNDIIQKDQTSANGWATIKQLTLSGTENLSDIVYLTISDKATGEKYVTDAAVPVTDGKYSYTCTPSIEGDANGRTYVVTAKDRIGNTSTKEFIVSKTDGSCPQLKNGTSLTYTDWTTSKNISLNFFDFGASGVEASLDNQTDYKALAKSGEYYVWNHTFGNQVGTSEHTIYVRDALGNAGSYKLTVGNTDSTNYTIGYNLNGGLLSNQKTNYTVADSFTLPIPTKTGYTFTGWTGSNGTTPQDTVTINKGTRGNLSYTANWSANQYSVTYDANGGTGTMSVDTATYNENYVTKANQFIRIGYEFVGWTENADGSGSNWTSWIGKPWKWTYTKNITLYAQWKANTYTNWITHWTWGYKNQEGNNDYKTAFQLDTTTFQSQYGSEFTMDSTKAVKVPNGFYLKLFGTGAIDGIWKEYPIGTKVTQKAGNIVFEYDYLPYDYSITYNLNGGTNNSANPSTYNVLYGVSLKAPTRAGYTFTGWYDENGNKVTGINEGCNATFGSADDLYAKLATRTTGNRTLTAKWSYNPVSVKVPQMLTGDLKGNSQFRVKCNDFKAGNIKITVPNSFLYKQTGKADVTATITSKSGNNTITPTNKVCVYDITTTNGLSAGCWQGSFNIGLTLTKE